MDTSHGYDAHLTRIWLAIWIGIAAFTGSAYVVPNTGVGFYPGIYRINPDTAFYHVPLITAPAFLFALIPILLRFSKHREVTLLVPFLICFLAVIRTAMFKLGARGWIARPVLSPDLLVYLAFLCIPSVIATMVSLRHGLFLSGISALAYMPFERTIWYGFDTIYLTPFVIAGCCGYVMGDIRTQRVLAGLSCVPLVMMGLTTDFHYLVGMGWLLLFIPIASEMTLRYFGIRLRIQMSQSQTERRF